MTGCAGGTLPGPIEPCCASARAAMCSVSTPKPAGAPGIEFGTYYSLLDWSDPRYPSSDYVDDVVHPHVLDLVARYGSRMLWGDGHWGAGGGRWRSEDLVEAARKIDPELVVNDRWWWEGPGVKSFEYRLPSGVVGVPWEMRRGLGPSFGHNRAERLDHMLSSTAVIDLLTEVIAKGGHLLLCVGPDASGRMPEERASILRAAGQWVRRHQRPGRPVDAVDHLGRRDHPLRRARRSRARHRSRRSGALRRVGGRRGSRACRR